MASRSKKRSSNSSASPYQQKQVIPYPSASAKNILFAKAWAAYTLADSLCKDMLDDLRNVFPRKSADSFYALSLMLAANPNLKLDDVQNAYDQSVLADWFGKRDYSRSALAKFLKDDDWEEDYRSLFLKKRIKSASKQMPLLLMQCDYHMERDETHCSVFSRSSCRSDAAVHINALCAFDLTNMEPVCSQIPYSYLSRENWRTFIEKYSFPSCIFDTRLSQSSDAQALLQDCSNLHFLRPADRQKAIDECDSLLVFDGTLPSSKVSSIKEPVRCSKRKCAKTGTYFYTFSDPTLYKQERDAWWKDRKFTRANEKRFDEICNQLGILVFESDLDLPVDVIWLIVSENSWIDDLLCAFQPWNTEFTLDDLYPDKHFRYEEIVQSDDDSEWYDEDVDILRQGELFLNLLAAIVLCRLCRCFDKADLLYDRTYRDVLYILEATCLAPYSNGDSTIWQTVIPAPEVLSVLKALELL